MNDKVIKLYQPKQTDRQELVKMTLSDFTKFCEEEKVEGVICIAYRKDSGGKELIASFASHLRYTEKMGMLEEAKFKFAKD
jgi:hypothetical protein